MCGARWEPKPHHQSCRPRPRHTKLRVSALGSIFERRGYCKLAAKGSFDGCPGLKTMKYMLGFFTRSCSLCVLTGIHRYVIQRDQYKHWQLYLFTQYQRVPSGASQHCAPEGGLQPEPLQWRRAGYGHLKLPQFPVLPVWERGDEQFPGSAASVGFVPAASQSQPGLPLHQEER